MLKNKKRISADANQDRYTRGSKSINFWFIIPHNLIKYNTFAKK